MEETVISATEKKSATSSQINQVNAELFFLIRGIMCKAFVPPGQTVNGNFYWEVLRRLRENVRRKWTKIRKNGDWLLQHENAPAHTSLVVREFLTKNNMTIVLHPA